MAREEQLDFDETATTAVMNAYYPRVLAAPDSARNRAQAGWGIAGAVGTALAGAGVFATDGEGRSVLVLGFLAIFLWLTASLLFIRAVAVPSKAVGEGTSTSHSGFVRTVFENARSERDQVDDRQKWARRALYSAVTATLATLLVAVWPFTQATRSWRIILTDKGYETVALLCGEISLPLPVEGPHDLLGADQVTLTVDAEHCHGRTVTLTLPRDLIAAAAR
ncbi:MAG TPA: hypothetical protein VJZ25_00995 [Gemmatimonadaceae bacterium]|nr:hypothetical protein [Gemmatimonadaceae bacterium]